VTKEIDQQIRKLQKQLLQAEKKRTRTQEQIKEMQRKYALEERDRNYISRRLREIEEFRKTLQNSA
jgi:septation ring formation regulator EzrA